MTSRQMGFEAIYTYLVKQAAGGESGLWWMSLYLTSNSSNEDCTLLIKQPRKEVENYGS